MKLTIIILIIIAALIGIYIFTQADSSEVVELNKTVEEAIVENDKEENISKVINISVSSKEELFDAIEEAVENHLG